MRSLSFTLPGLGCDSHGAAQVNAGGLPGSSQASGLGMERRKLKSGESYLGDTGTIQSKLTELPGFWKVLVQGQKSFLGRCES